MATVGFVFPGYTKNFTVSGADGNRILAALKSQQGQIAVTTVDPVTKVETITYRDKTNNEVFDTLTTSWMQALKDVVKAAEGDAAAKSARNAVTDIVAT